MPFDAHSKNRESSMNLHQCARLVSNLTIIMVVTKLQSRKLVTSGLSIALPFDSPHIG